MLAHKLFTSFHSNHNHPSNSLLSQPYTQYTVTHIDHVHPRPNFVIPFQPFDRLSTIQKRLARPGPVQSVYNALMDAVLAPSLVPIVDLSRKRSSLPEVISRACEEYGMFKVVNHGVSMEVIAGLEKESLEFFSRSTQEKQKAGPAPPFSYGCKEIGSNGDMGELEYILLHNLASNPSGAVNDYVGAMRDLACEVLDLMEEGMWGPDKGNVSRLIRDVESDSLLRINHYLPSIHVAEPDGEERVGFGEHTDPQILTLLRSNDVGGLQICRRDGAWVAVPSDPNAFFVMVGDTLQVMTNMRYKSVKHRVVASTPKRRMSMMYFGAPPLDAWISPLPQLVEEADCTAEYVYEGFTWREYKKAAYASKLSDCRLNLFKRSHIT